MAEAYIHARAHISDLTIIFLNQLNSRCLPQLSNLSTHKTDNSANFTDTELQSGEGVDESHPQQIVWVINNLAKSAFTIPLTIVVNSASASHG